MHKLLPVLLLIFLVPVVHAQNTPVLLFSDMTSAPKAGWDGSATKGAAITVWGYNLGDSRGSSYITVNGVDLTSDSDYAVWGEYWPTQYWQRITFWLNSGMSDGAGSITVRVGGQTSNPIDFTIREGRIFRVTANNPGGDGSDANPFSGTEGSTGSRWLKNGIRPGDIYYFDDEEVWDEMIWGGQSVLSLPPTATNGNATHPIAFIAYPGDHPVMRARPKGSNPNRIINFNTNYAVASGFGMHSYTKSAVLGGNFHRLIGNDITGTLQPSQTGIVITGSSTNNKGGGNIILGNAIHGGRSGNKFDHAVYFSGCANESGNIAAWNHIYDNNLSRGPIFSINHQVDRCLSTQQLKSHFVANNIIDCSRQRSRAIGVGDLSWDEGEEREPEPTYVFNNAIIGCGVYDDQDLGGNSYKVGSIPAIDHGNGHARFYNNLLYDTGNRGIQVGGSEQRLTSLIRNNLIVINPTLPEDPAHGTHYIMWTTGADLTEVNTSHNLYYGANSYRACSGCSQDEHHVLGEDPLFVDESNGILNIQSGSPAKNTGFDSLVFEVQPPSWLSINRDMVYTARSSGIDIGPLEFGSTLLSLFVTNASSNVNVSSTNQTPTILSYYPSSHSRMNRSKTQHFNITATDADNDVLTYSWYVNGTLNRTGQTWNLNGTRFKKGTWNITAIVTDGNTSDTHTWTFKIRTPKKQDITDDDVVDVRDLRIIAKHVIKKKAWRAQYDQNNDGIVNIFDLISVIREFGTY